MSTESQKQTIKNLLNAHLDSDRNQIAEILSPKLAWHMAGEMDVMSREDYLQGIDMGREAFGHKSCEIEQIIADGDRVVSLVKWRMTHTGKFMDIEATQRKVEFSAMWMYRFVDDKIVEIWSFDENFTAQLR